MLLIKIKEVFEKNNTLSVFELKAMLKANSEVLKQAVEFWIKRGKLKKVTAGNNLCCTTGKTCNVCNVTDFELYSWVE